MSEIARLEKKLDQLLSLVKENKKPTWVRASVITSLTGWSAEKMRQARENGYVKYKESEGSYLYDLNSINDKFFKH
jgi:hypothetical protein